MPMRMLPSRQAGACGSGAGSGRYSSLLSKMRIEVSEAVICGLRSPHSIESPRCPQIDDPTRIVVPSDEPERGISPRLSHGEIRRIQMLILTECNPQAL